MARSLSNANLVAAIADGVALALTRRGYLTATWKVGKGIAKQVEESNKKVSMSFTKTDGASDPSSFWGPDPVTGYYRPSNRVGDVDVAELRKLLLSEKFEST